MKFTRVITVSLFIFFSLFSAPNIAKLPTEVSGNSLPSLAPMLKRVMPSIVSISGVKRMKAIPVPIVPPGQELPPMPSGPGQPQLEDHISTMIGSGVIVDAEKGYILTNAHVVSEMDEIEVALSDHRKYDAKMLGYDIASDLALLQISARNLKQITFANSDQVDVGDFVVAIGSPYGFKQTVTSGIVSAIGRNDLGFDGYYDFIQTDADINMGNSGGGLLNLNGELIGINTVIVSPSNSGGSVGIGFAIPTNMAKGILTQLANTGRVDRGPLGVQVQPLTPELAKAFKVNTNDGAVINNILPNTPAELAGLQIGDILLKVDQKTIKDSMHLRTLISMIPTGTSVKVQFSRNGKLLTLPVMITDPKKSYTEGSTIFSGLKGSFLQTADPTNSPIPGVKITEIKHGTPASHSDLQEGDLIIAATLEKQQTPTVESLKQAAATESEVLLLHVAREKYSFFVALKQDKG